VGAPELSVFDWGSGGVAPVAPPAEVSFLDETLRDGLQSPSVRQPSLGEKVSLLHLIGGVGIATANVGYPGSGSAARRDAEALCREIAAAGLSLGAKCAGRTCANDVLPVVEIAQRTGLALEMGMFLGVSPLRIRTEGWEFDRLMRLADHWAGFATRWGVRVLFVTEDTTRSRPEDIARIYQTAVRAGAARVCIADTVGCATPVGAHALVRFVRATLDAAGAAGVGIDWHGHNDRGLAVANSLAAALAGADRLHGTALGVGERVGNAAIEHLLANAFRLGWARPRLELVPSYLQAACSALGIRHGGDLPLVLESLRRLASSGPRRSDLRLKAS